MKVFLYEEVNPLNTTFLLPEYEIPFLGSNLLDFSKNAFQRLADYLGEELEYYVPGGWAVNELTYDGNLLSALHEEEPELVFFTNVYSLFFGAMDKEYIHHLKQNRGKAFKSNGTVCSYLSRSDGLNEPQDDESLRVFFYLDLDNYLRTSQKLMTQLDTGSVEHTAKTFGEPIVRTSTITNSTVCAPSFIGPDVSLVNCYIAPGSIITGNSHLANTRVFSSALHGVNASDSELESVISAESIIEHLKLKDSNIPAGSVIRSEG